MIPSKMRDGVTLIEIMVSLVLVSTVLLVSLTASANLMRNDAENRTASDAQWIVGWMLDEISAAEFRDREAPVYGIESDEDAADRTTYDDVDDYHNFTQSPPTFRNGVAMDGFDGWTISVTVTPAIGDATGIVTSNDDSDPLRRIVVNCDAPDGTRASADAIVSNVPTNLPESISYERWRQVDLRYSQRQMSISAPLRNHPDAD